MVQSSLKENEYEKENMFKESEEQIEVFEEEDIKQQKKNISKENQIYLTTGIRIFYYRREGDEDIKRVTVRETFEVNEKIYLYKISNGNRKRVSGENNILPTKTEVILPSKPGVYKVIWKRKILEYIDLCALIIVLLLIPFIIRWVFVEVIPLIFITLWQILLLIEYGLLVMVAIFTPIRIIISIILSFKEQKFKKPKFKWVSSIDKYQFSKEK